MRQVNKYQHMGKSQFLKEGQKSLTSNSIFMPIFVQIHFVEYSTYFKFSCILPKKHETLVLKYEIIKKLTL